MGSQITSFDGYAKAASARCKPGSTIEENSVRGVPRGSTIYTLHLYASRRTNESITAGSVIFW
jgi:hypothetical protein